ncbi:MAG: glycoside hydrolase family 3 protein [Balneolaceae bacterium]
MKIATLLFSFFLFLPPWASAQADTASSTALPPLDVKIGQLLNVGFRGLAVDESSHIVRDLRKYHLGSVVLFDYDVPSQSPVRNIQSAAQLKQLVSDLGRHATKPLLVAVDQEGGRVARLKPRFGFPHSVSARYLGTVNQRDTTYAYASLTAQTLSELGIHINLAPVVDLNLNPENPVIGSIERSFSPDPLLVTRHARIFIEAHHEQGVFTTLKHFPGHGSSRDDSHIGLVDVTDYWSEKELIPYRNLIESGHTDIIMTAHIVNENWDNRYPATLSGNVLTHMLRRELGFEGVVMSDDMQMDAIRSHFGLEKAIELAILAGVDILSFANNSVYDPDIIPKAHSIVKELVESGRVSESRINESYLRIMDLKNKL